MATVLMFISYPCSLKYFWIRLLAISAVPAPVHMLKAVRAWTMKDSCGSEI